MKKRKGFRWIAVMLILVLTASLFTGCGGKDEKEKADSISVYLWNNGLYKEYAPYIQSQLLDVDIEFVVGNNDLDFYTFMKENGALPDIITCRRFSLRDAQELKEQLMDLSYTEEASAIYQTYLENYTNDDGTVNWLPLCGEADGFIAKKALFDEYKIPLPTDYDSFVSACKAFEKVGIRGFISDFEYDYTCMEVLQGLSIPELTSMDGQIWRHSYEEPSGEEVGLDETIWPGAFVRMEQFIQDVNMTDGDVTLSYNPVQEMYLEGKAAIIRGTGADVVGYKEGGIIDPVFLPYYGQNGEEWLLTYPAFHVALNKDLEKDTTRKENALQILHVMLSEEGQNVLAKNQDVISYSKNVDLKNTQVFDNVRSCIEQNHLYIRMASNEFFSTSKDVVQKMILGEYDAKQAYDAFDEQLRQPAATSEEKVMTLEEGYSNEFYKEGGNASASTMANTLRQFYGSEVLVAPAYSFTGSVLKADYTEKMAGSMIMPNSLEAWQCEWSGAEVTAYLKASIEGTENGFVPFNRASLPAVSGISIEVSEEGGKYTLNRVLKDGKEIGDADTFKVTCLNTMEYMERFLEEGEDTFTKEELRVKDAWIEYINEGGNLAEPEKYITLK